MQTKTIEVIRHSLAAASAALSLLEIEPVRTESVVEAAPVPALTAEEVAALVEPASSGPDLRFVALMNELDGRYALRTVGELEDKLGLTYTQMTTKLEDEGVEFVTRTRRSDSALLIGLASRN